MTRREIAARLLQRCVAMRVDIVIPTVDSELRPALLAVNPRAPGALPLTVASGVDMPRLTFDALRGRKPPEHVDFREIAMVRFLEECFIELGEVRRVAA